MYIQKLVCRVQSSCGVIKGIVLNLISCSDKLRVSLRFRTKKKMQKESRLMLSRRLLDQERVAVFICIREK